MRNLLRLSSAGSVPYSRDLRRAVGAVGLLGGLLLSNAQGAQAQTCNQVVNFNYTNVVDGDRTVGSDKLSSGTPGTTVTYSGYAATTPAAINTFAVGANGALANTGKFLVWQRNVTGGGPTTDVASVVFTFSRPVSNLTMSVTDLDQDLVNASFTDRVTFDGYATAAGGTAIDLQPANFSGPGLNVKNKFVGTGSGATAATDPAFKANAVTGIAENPGVTTGDVTVSFPSPVTRVVITYENIAPLATATTDRTHTIGFGNITFCAQADVYASVTSGPTAAQPGSSVTYSALFGNNGPDDSNSTTRTATIPAGATVTNLGGGTLRGNILDFGTVTSVSGSSATFNYAYTLPNTTGVYSAPTTAATATGANQNGATANDTDTRTALVAPVTDISTTISGPANATQGNLVTLNVTTTNNGTSSTGNVVQTVQLATNLTNVFVSNNGTYVPSTGLVTFPTLPTLAAGQTVGNYISFSAPPTTFAPVATVTPNTVATGDSNPSNNTAYLNGATAATNIVITPTTAAVPVANLYISISASAQTVNPGTSVTLSGMTANAGPSTASSVVQTVQLLPGFTASTITINGGASTSQSGNDLLFAGGTKYNTVTGLVTFATIPTLASGASQNYSIQFTAPANVGDQLPATAFVGSTATGAAVTTDPVPADNVAATKVQILPTADVAVTLLGPTSVSGSLPVMYTAIFTNKGPGAAINFAPTMQLPAGLTNVLLTAGTYNMTTGLVTFPTSPSTAAGIAQLYTIVFTPPTTGNYTATAYTGSNTPDPVAGNNSASVTTNVTPAADLTVKLSGPDNAASGGPITYVAQTTNNGPSTAGTVTTTIQLPTGLLAANVTSSNGVYNPASGLVTFTNTNLPNGATVSNFATFANPRAAGVVLVSGATVSSTTNDPVPGNNNSAPVNTNTTNDTSLLNLSTAITASAASVAPGATFTLGVTFDSNGIVPVALMAEKLYLPPGTPLPAVTDNIAGRAIAVTYDQASGVLTFPFTTLSRKAPTDSYTVTVTAPATGPFKAVSTISSPQPEAPTDISNNVASVDVTITPTVTTVYNETSTLSGPASALPGAPLTYTVQSVNNGPANSGSVVQTVTLPAGVTATNISNGGTQTGNIITFPVTVNQSPGPGGIATNTFTVTMPATGSLAISTNSTASGESNTTDNSAQTTTTAANQTPVAVNVVNALKAPLGNTAGQQLISSLAAVDADGTIAGFQLTSIPNPTTQGTLYYDNGGTYTAITSATQALTPAQAATLKFSPVAGYVGNALFGYAATDNSGNVSLPVLYTIQVGQDNASLYGTTPVKGGTLTTGNTKYANGDVLAYVVDVNGARYNNAGLMYDPTTGALAAGAVNGLPTTGVNVASPTTTAQFVALGFALDPATGIISVLDRTKLVAGSYPFTLTTTDLFGGVTTQAVTIVIGAKPLPVELKEFTATAVKNLDAALNWATASEKNNDHFDVERSFNGSDFAAIAQVKGNGTSTAQTDYALTDAGVGRKANGTVYYRLNQVDFDGKSSYSPVRTVAFTSGATLAISLAPNPATSSTQLDLSGLPAGTYQVSVLDVTGRTVRHTTLAAGLGHELPLNGLANGTYVVRVNGTNNGQTVNLAKRLVKE